MEGCFLVPGGAQRRSESVGGGARGRGGEGRRGGAIRPLENASFRSEGEEGGGREEERGGGGRSEGRGEGGEARAWQAIASVSIREEPDRGGRERGLASEGALSSEGGGSSL